MSHIDAVISLSGWKSVTSPSSLLGQFFEERNYFQFKSFLLFKPLTHPTALQMLLDFVSINGTAGVLFEFQTLGGENSTFSKVAPEDTAFAHRHARYCMMLKSWGATRAEGDFMFGLMTNLTYALSKCMLWYLCCLCVELALKCTTIAQQLYVRCVCACPNQATHSGVFRATWLIIF